jgi:tetratricopeptide (TPR) repeat protein/DNA-binding transcriptional MerR regulator
MNKETVLPSLDELTAMRCSIEERTAHIPRQDKLQLRELINCLQTLRVDNLTEARLRHFQRLGLISPGQDIRGYYRYSRDDVRDVILICKLHHELDLSYAQIGGLLLSESKQKLIEAVQAASREAISTSPPNQIERAHLYWRSHLMMIVLAWFFNGNIPHFARILICQERRVNNGKQPRWLNAEQCGFQDVEDYLDEARRGTIGLITTEDREVLHKHQSWEDWKEYHNCGFDWYLLKTGAPDLSKEFHVVISVPPGMVENGYVRHIHNEETQQTTSAIIDLLEGCFEIPPTNSSENNQSKHVGTRLAILVNLIPNLSPNWQYCAILRPSASAHDQLELAFCSEGFPSGLKPDVLVPFGQLLCGWSYLNNQHVFVQKSIGAEDPRIFYQKDEKTLSAAAIPTTVNNEPNGVLYIGTQNLAENQTFLKESDVQFLRILGTVLGELIDLQHVKDRTSLAARRIIDEPRFKVLSWSEFQESTLQIIRSLDKESVTEPHTSLHTVIVRINNYHEIELDNKEVAVWIAEQIRRLAHQYYLSRSLGEAKLYDYEINKFALQISAIPMRDSDEQALRRDLHARLNSMMLYLLPGKTPVEVSCDIWSIPFRHSDLLRKIDELGVENVAKRLVIKAAEQGFRYLSFIPLAHNHEKNGAWEKALELYERAHSIDPDNPYIWRHIAKACTQVHNYETAIRWWWRIIDDYKHPSYYRRLAYNLACIGDYAQAIEKCEKATELDEENSGAYSEWGNVLEQARDYGSAIDKFLRAAHLDKHNRAKYLLRVAKLRFMLGEYRSALSTCSQASTYESDNPDIAYLVMQISQAIRKPQKQVFRQEDEVISRPGNGTQVNQLNTTEP